MGMDIFDTEVLFIREWAELIAHPYFYRLKDKLQEKIRKIDTDLYRLGRQPNLDNAIEVISKQACKNDLHGLLQFFDQVLEQKIQLDREGHV